MIHSFRRLNQNILFGISRKKKNNESETNLFCDCCVEAEIRLPSEIDDVVHDLLQFLGIPNVLEKLLEVCEGRMVDVRAHWDRRDGTEGDDLHHQQAQREVWSQERIQRREHGRNENGDATISARTDLDSSREGHPAISALRLILDSRSPDHSQPLRQSFTENTSQTGSEFLIEDRSF